MAGLVFLLVFWVLAGACQGHGVGGFLLCNPRTTASAAPGAPPPTSTTARVGGRGVRRRELDASPAGKPPSSSAPSRTTASASPGASSPTPATARVEGRGVRRRELDALGTLLPPGINDDGLRHHRDRRAESPRQPADPSRRHGASYRRPRNATVGRPDDAASRFHCILSHPNPHRWFPEA